MKENEITIEIEKEERIKKVLNQKEKERFLELLASEKSFYMLDHTIRLNADGSVVRFMSDELAEENFEKFEKERVSKIILREMFYSGELDINNSSKVIAGNINSINVSQ
jgi:hypothetical protein